MTCSRIVSSQHVFHNVGSGDGLEGVHRRGGILQGRFRERLNLVQYMQDSGAGRGFGQGGPTFVKIAVFTDSYRPYVSGVVRSIDTFGAQLLALGHDVYVFGPRYYGHINGEERPPRGPHSVRGRDGAIANLDEEGILPDGRRAATEVFRFWSIPVPMYRGFTAPVPISSQADELLDQLGIDIIHSHTPFAMGTLGALLAKKRRLPLVFTHHTMYHEYVHYLPGVRAVLQPMMLRYVGNYCRRSDLVIAPTPHIREFIVDEYEVRGRDAVAIPTGIELADFAAGNGSEVRRRFGIGEHDKVLTFVGRLGLEKNVGFLLNVLSLLHERRTDVHLVLVGDGPERQQLVDTAAALGVGDRLHLTGTLTKDEVSNVFHGSDLFVIASTSETQGLATLEAMAAGLPVVGVDAPGTKDMVEQGVQGVLTPEAPDAFAGAVLQLLDDGERYAAYARAARTRAEAFTARNMTLRLLSAYERVLANRAVRHAGRDSAVAVE